MLEDQQPRTARRRIVALLAVTATALAGFVALAGAAQAVAPVQFVDGGTSAPPGTLGGFPMTPFPVDSHTQFSMVNSVANPAGTGNVGFNPSLQLYQVGSGWSDWTNGYTGSVYYNSTSTVTLTLPTRTRAFYFYVEPNAGGTFNFTATTDNGTSSGTQTAVAPSGARGFDFYTTDGSGIASITITGSTPTPSGYAIGEFGINWLTPPAPTLSGPNAPNFHAGSPTTESASYSASTYGATTTLTCSCSALPTGLQFTPLASGTNAAAQIAGEAGATSGGTYNVTVTATSSEGTVTNLPVTVIVVQAPTFLQSGVTLTAGTLANLPFFVHTTGYPPATITYTGSLPPGITFTNNGDGTVTFGGTPNATDAGLYPVTLTAANGVTNPAIETFTFTVDQAPAIAGGYAYPVYSKVGSYFSYSYASYVSGYPAPTVTWSGSLPSGVSFGGACGYATLCGTPADHTGANWFGTLIASNGVGSNATSGTLLQVEEAPWFSGATSATFVANQANTSGAVTTYGGYNPPTQLMTVGTLPPWLSFDAATGEFSGTPPVSASGYYSITVQACNGYYPAVPSLAMCRTETFTIFVQAPNAPMPTNAPASDGLLSGVDIITGSGSTVSWSGTGFAPYAPVTLAIYNAQTYKKQFTVATVDADANGSVTFAVTVPNTTGIKYVVAGGYKKNGKVQYLTGQTRFM